MFLYLVCNSVICHLKKGEACRQVCPVPGNHLRGFVFGRYGRRMGNTLSKLTNEFRYRSLFPIA